MKVELIQKLVDAARQKSLYLNFEDEPDDMVARILLLLLEKKE